MTITAVEDIEQIANSDSQQNVSYIEIYTEPLADGKAYLARSPRLVAVECSNGQPQNIQYLSVLRVKPDAHTSQWQKWLSETSSASDMPLVSVAFAGGRIAYNGARAVVVASEQSRGRAMVLLAEFHLLCSELTELELSLDIALAQAERDVALTHQVSPREFERWEKVNQMTRLIAVKRVEFTRLEGSVMKAGIATSDSGKCLYQMIKMAEFEDRMEHVDDKIDVIADIYELANDRLSEFSYFHREYKVELWITWILIIELALLVADIFVHAGS